MSEQENSINKANEDFLDLGSDPDVDDFDPFASDDDFDVDIKTDTTTQEKKQKHLPYQPIL